MLDQPPKASPQQLSALNLSCDETASLQGNYLQDLRNSLSHKRYLVRSKHGFLYYGRLLEGKPQDDSCVCVFADGAVYRGQVANGKRHGKGTFQTKSKEYYSGEWRDGEPYGEGVEQIPMESTYQGQFHRGIKQGWGLILYSDGGKYEGQFLNNQIHGKGKYTVKAAEWEGNWVWGYLQGKGTEKSETFQYEGMFRRGIKDGEGMYKWNKDIIYKGGFKNGQMHGEGKIIIQDVQFQGCWDQGFQTKQLKQKMQEGNLSQSIVMHRSNKIHQHKE